MTGSLFQKYFPRRYQAASFEHWMQRWQKWRETKERSRNQRYKQWIFSSRYMWPYRQYSRNNGSKNLQKGSECCHFCRSL